ncbi:MAG: helix-turn-helix domain-containing protein [Tannerellaceae bacterium]|nr:helix-turn-helix domain-containing protein [Tannerellaceae bacterium]
MIRNKKQYTALSEEVKRLEEEIADLTQVLQEDNAPRAELRLQLSGMNRFLQKYRKQLSEYERLVADDLLVLEFDSLRDDMNKAILSFRIASGLTQKEIARQMYLHEQQIQRYEQNDYLSAGFERILQLLDVLGVQIILRKEIRKEENKKPTTRFLLGKDAGLILQAGEAIKERGQIMASTDTI